MSMHDFYIFLYYFIVYAGLLAQAAFIVPFKKNRKAVCLLSCALLLLPTVIIAIVTGIFPTGREQTPLWFYLSPLACLIPLYFWGEGNFIVNFIIMFPLGFIHNIMTECCIGLVLCLISPEPVPVRCLTSLSQFDNVLWSVLAQALESAATIMLVAVMRKIFKKNWLANVMLVVYLIPVLLIAYIYTDSRYEYFRVDLHVSTMAVDILYIPVFFLLVLLSYHIRERIVLKRKLNSIEKEYDSLFAQYESYMEHSLKTRYWRHDINNHLSVIENMIEKEQSGKERDDNEEGYIDENGQSDEERRNDKISRTVAYNQTDRELKRGILKTAKVIQDTKKTDIVDYSGKSLLDALLTIKKLQADEREIPIDYNILLPGSSSVSDYDLITLLSNLLDNAMEATAGVDEDKRKIGLSLYEKNGYLCVDALNTTKEDPFEKEFMTSKSDKINHGLGTHIIHSVVKKYKGYEKRFTQEGIFHYFIALKMQ